MKRTRLFYTFLALLFLIIGGILSSRHNAEESSATDETFSKESITFPREEMQRRRPAQPRTNHLQHNKPKKADPSTHTATIEKAVNAAEHNPFLFLEFNGLQHNPLVEALMECHQDTVHQTIQATLDLIGVDLEKDVDRIALAPDLFVISGFFDNFRLPPPPDGTEAPPADSYGANAQIYSLETIAPKGQAQDLEPERVQFAQVGENLLLLSRERGSIEQAIDRVEGRTPMGPRPAFSGSGGDIYGQIAGEWLLPFQAMIRNSLNSQELDPDILEKVMVRSFIEDHMAVSADLHLKDTSKRNDILSMGNGLLAASRFDAMRSADKNLADVLDQVNLKPGPGGQIAVDLALPKALILEWAQCAQPEETAIPDSQ
jgi:hypothetical protein